MALLTSAPTVEQFLARAAARGFDREQLSALLQIVGTPPVATHLPELIATLNAALPLARRIDPVGAGREAARFEPLLLALASAEHASWLSTLRPYLPRGFPQGGTLAGFTGRHPVYACLVQAQHPPCSEDQSVARALLLVHRLAPRPLDLRGEVAGAEKDAADAIRRALQGELDWIEVVDILPDEEEIARAPLDALDAFVQRLQAGSPRAQSRLRLFRSLALALLGRAAGPLPPPILPPGPPPPKAPWQPPTTQRKGRLTLPWPPEFGGGLLPGGGQAWEPVVPPPPPRAEEDAELDGLAPDERASGALLIHPDTTARPWEPGEVALAHFGLRYATLLDHQHLIWRWPALNTEDLSLLSEAILAALRESASNPPDTAALVLGLMLVLGRSPEELARVMVVSDLSAVPDTVFAGDAETITLAEGLWIHPTRAPADGYKPRRGVREFLDPVVPWLRLPLPEPLMQALRRHVSATPYSLLDTLQMLGADPVHALRRWLRLLRRRNPGLRATPARVRDALYFRLVAESADPVAAAFTLGLTRMPVGSGRYYASFRPDTLQRLYRNTLQRALPAFSPLMSAEVIAVDPAVGSRLRPAPGVVEALADRLGDALLRRLPAAGTAESLANAHNAMVLYTLGLLFYATGLRAVTDPFESAALMLSDLGVGVVADKVHQRSREGRPIHLCATAIGQLEAYLAHLKALAGRFARHDAALAQRIAATATASEGALFLFFFLDRTGERWQPVRIAVRRLREELAAFGWVLPLNTQRHVLASALRTPGVQAEHVAAQLGHAQFGDHALGPYSVLGPGHLQPLLEETDALLERLGWSVRAGVSPHRSRPGQTSSGVDALVCIPGHAIRAARREGPDLRRRRLLDLAAQVVPDGTWSGPRVRELAARIAALNLDPGEISRLEQVAARWLGRRAPAALAASGWQPGFLLLPEPAPIDLSHAPLIREAQDLERRLHAAIDLEPCPDSVESLARIVVAAALDGICSGRRLAALLGALLQGDFYGWEDQVWVECGQAPFPRRWCPGFLPALLLLSWRERNPGLPDETAVRRRLARRWLKGQSPDGVLAHLAAVAAAYARVRLPGYLAAYAREETESSSLPLGAWMRLLTARPLAVDEIPLPDPSPVGTSGKSRATTTDKATWGLWRELRETLLGHEEGRISRHAALQTLSTLKHPDAAPVARTLAAWAYDMLARARRALAPSTVRGYVLTIGGFLIAAARDLDDYLLLEADDYEELYAQVLDMGSPGNRDYRGRRLASYHAFLEVHYRAAELVTGLFRRSGTAPQVSANLLTLAEYRQARNLIEADGGRAPGERRVAALALAVLFWIGPRVGEWRRVRVCDVLLGEPGAVLVRSFARARTKTIRGQRQIPVGGRLPQQDWEALAAWCDCRRRDSGARAQVFTAGGAFDLAQYLTWTIRRVSGEAHLTLRHLRHAATTYSVLWADPPATGLPDGWGKAEPGALRLLSFGEGQREPTRRTLFQVAVQQGHASPGTTLTHYTHLLDWRLGQERPVSRIPPVETIAAMTGLTTGNLHVIRHRKPSDRAFASEIIRRGVRQDPSWHGVLSAMVDAELGTPSDSSACVQPDLARLSLGEVAEVLDLASIGVDPERISTRTLMPSAAVRGLLAAARDVQRESGYAEWGLDGPSLPHPPRPPRNHRYDEQVANLETALRRGDTSVLAMLELWRRRYQPIHTAVPLDHPDEVAVMIGGLAAAGFPPDTVAIVAGPRHPIHHEPDLREALAARLGYTPRVVAGAAMTARGVAAPGRGRAMGVALAPGLAKSKRHGRAAVRAWHRGCYLASILASLLPRDPGA